MSSLPLPPRSMPVALPRWAVLYVPGSRNGHKPFACSNCHMLIKPAERCAIHGPDVVIRPLKRGGVTFTPVCGLWDGGKPMEKAMYPSTNDPDLTGLEWVKGSGTNCGGVNGGRGCTRHYIEQQRYGHGLGFCRVLQDDVGGTDCCAANEPVDPFDENISIPWREAQQILRGQRA